VDLERHASYIDPWGAIMPKDSKSVHKGMHARPGRLSLLLPPYSASEQDEEEIAIAA
jgi:hypothetical protein